MIVYKDLYLYFLFQVWFQNRRTKWRKKHAAEMATAKRKQEELGDDLGSNDLGGQGSDIGGSHNGSEDLTHGHPSLTHLHHSAAHHHLHHSDHHRRNDDDDDDDDDDDENDNRETAAKRLRRELSEAGRGLLGQ